MNTTLEQPDEEETNDDSRPVDNDDDAVDVDEQVKEKIQREKEELKQKRKEEEERKKQEEKERLLAMRPTEHKLKAGGGEPKNEKTKERRDTVRKVRSIFS